MKRDKERVRPIIPLTIIAGYLGSGKTTLLNRVIARCDTSRMAILVNDFGELNIDAQLVELGGATAYRLESGCICCSIADGLTMRLLALLRMEPRVQHILIEASGVADPARIADIARLSPSLRPGCTAVMADCARIEAQLGDDLIGETVQRQLACADLLVLNKMDLLSGDALAALVERLAERFAPGCILTGCHGHIPLDRLMSVPARSASRQRIKGRVVSVDRRAASPDHGEVFWTVSYESHALFVRDRFEQALGELIPRLQRAKGFVRFEDAPAHLMIVHVSGSGVAITRARREDPAVPNCRLSFIGVGESLKKETVTAIMGRAAALQ